MTIKPFQQLRDRETPTSSARWYQDMIRKLGMGNIQPQKVMRSDIGEFVTNITVGSMYLFMYDPKMSATLPYYDTLPVVVTFRKVPDGFYGLNLHYLPPLLRLKLLDRMMELVNDESMGEKTRMIVTWKLLSNVARYPGTNVAVKQYLYEQVGSKIMKIYPKDWRKTIMLPIDNFQKASRNQVFQDARSKI